MRQFKKTLLGLLCVCVIFVVTACGTNRTTGTGGANGTADTTQTDNNNRENVDQNKKDNVNVENTERKNNENDGVLEDVGRGIDNGVRDVVDGVEDVVDGNGNRATDHQTTNTTGNGNVPPTADNQSAR